MAETDPKQHPDSALIDALGGTSETAKLCEVSPQAVSQWRSDGIPPARLLFLKAVRPALFKPRKVAA